VRPTRNAAPARFGSHRRPLLGPHETDLRRLIEARPNTQLAEIQAELHERLGILAGLSTIHNALHRIGLQMAALHGRSSSSTRPAPPPT
jgi:hypothetical protein